MRKLNKLAAAIAVALSAGVMAPQANAVISTHYDQEGDALIFPVYYGVLENYYTIHNNSNLWVQGHLRFRNAAWTGEVLDMDVILSPNDVFVFRLTDMDGDGYWELDQSLDPRNFMYTGHSDATCSGNVPEVTGSTTTVSECHDFSTALFPTEPADMVVGDNILDPSLYPNISDQVISDAKAYGYIEFIGEAVLVGCDTQPREGCDLDGDGDNQNDWPLNSWVWDQNDPDGNGIRDDLDGVGNWLSGQFWIAMPGANATSGMSGAAVMFRDFRTDDPLMCRRVTNYPDPEVILHIDDPTTADDAYVYRFPDSSAYERDVSFNNTWGPTLADGDDYNLGIGSVLNYTVLDAAGTPPTANTFDGTSVQTLPPIGNVAVMDAYRQGTTSASSDYWDDIYGADIYNQCNSIAEVDLAINRNAQNFSGHFFDGASNSKAAGAMSLLSVYFAHFPTKFYRAEEILSAVPPSLSGGLFTHVNLGHRINHAVNGLLDSSFAKIYDVEVWDLFENHECTPGTDTIVSPSPVEVRTCQWPFSYELSLVTIQDLKSTQSGVSTTATEGQVLLFPTTNNLASANPTTFNTSYPALLYGFDLELGAAGADLSHWLPMFRSEWVQD